MTRDSKQKEELLRLVHEYVSLQKRLHEVGDPEDAMNKYGVDAWFDATEQATELIFEMEPLRWKIEELLIECKLYPLMGLPEDVCGVINKSFGDEPSERHLVYDAEKGSVLLDSSTYINPADENMEKRLQEKIEEKYLLDAKVMIKRLKDAPFFISNFYISEHVRYLYHQVVNCYVHGFFEASCALARATSETAEQEVIYFHSAGDRLSDREKNQDKKSTWQILLEIGIPQEILDIKRWGICGKANRVLHDRGMMSDAATLEIIKTTKLFIEKLFEVSAVIKKNQKR